MTLNRLPACVKWTIDASIEYLWAFSSGSKSQMLVPSSTLGIALTAPDLISILSTSVVFPEDPCPHKATLRRSSILTFAIPDPFIRPRNPCRQSAHEGRGLVTPLLVMGSLPASVRLELFRRLDCLGQAQRTLIQ